MLKGIFLCFFLVSSFFLFAQPGMDVLHYKFEIELSDHSDTIKGKAEIKILLTQWNKSISFDLVNLNNKGKGMTVTKVSFLRPASSVSFQQQNDKLIITPSIAFNPDDTAVIVINYKGIPADGLIISKNKYGDRTFFADNWPNRAHNWIPCKDEPGDKSNFEFLVTAPSKYDVISNGKKIEERSINTYKKLTHWSSDIPLPTKVMVIGVARFAVKEYPDSPPDIPVSAWVYPQDSITGFRNYSVAPSILKFMSAYIAPYPYNKLANVESTTIFGGMENAGAIFYFEGSASSNNTQESLIAHEIAHQWFGDMASEKKFSHLWLSEGFATYLTHVYMESRYGAERLKNPMKADGRQVISFSRGNTRPVVDS
ncbi:MAG: M1 family metallopeptidase, partial [Bacteroidetes bacterium]|nr:M1 family metallopeptidase [Bacteroidota bacterium]